MKTINTMLNRMMADVYTPEGALRDEMLLDTQWIERDVRRWCQQKGREALQSGSAAIDVFRKRKSIIPAISENLTKRQLLAYRLSKTH